MGFVDVVTQLEAKAGASPQELNWRTSIVDLLKLFDIDSSFAALHKEVLTRIAANGGNVTKELLA